MNLVLLISETLLVVGVGVTAFWLFDNRGRFLQRIFGRKLSKGTKDVIVATLIIALFFVMMYFSDQSGFL